MGVSFRCELLDLQKRVTFDFSVNTEGYRFVCIDFSQIKKYAIDSTKTLKQIIASKIKKEIQKSHFILILQCQLDNKK
jgi:hypothetical protein